MKFLSIILLVFVLSAAWIDMPGPEPYTPVYPAYFGNRVDIPADNPMTVQGIQLGRMLFYETAGMGGREDWSSRRRRLLRIRMRWGRT